MALLLVVVVAAGAVVRRLLFAGYLGRQVRQELVAAQMAQHRAEHHPIMCAAVDLARRLQLVLLPLSLLTRLLQPSLHALPKLLRILHSLRHRR